MSMGHVCEFLQKIETERYDDLSKSKVTQERSHDHENGIQIPWLGSVYHLLHQVVFLGYRKKEAWETYNLTILLDRFLQNTWEAGPEQLRHLRSL